VALGRKNFLFAGSDGGGESAAAIYSLVGSAKLNGIDPESYLRNVLSRIADHPIKHIEELLRGTSPQVYSSPTKSGINENAATNVPTNSLPELPYIEETIETRNPIGIIPPLSECVAVAHEGRHTLAMLKRQKGESLAQLLTRLDLAIARAHTDDISLTRLIRPLKSQRP